MRFGLPGLLAGLMLLALADRARAAKAGGDTPKTVELTAEDIRLVKKYLPDRGPNREKAAALAEKLDGADGKPVELTPDEIHLAAKYLHVAEGEDEEKATKVIEKLANPPRSMFEKALDLGIWTLLVFLVLFAVLGKFAWKPMLQGLEAREHTIAAAAEDAKKSKDEARALRDEILRERKQMAEEIARNMDEARADANRLKEQIKTEAAAEISAERERLLREVGIAKDQALKEIWTRSADLAAMISTKAIRQNLSADAHRGLVEEALAGLNSAVQERRKALAEGNHA